MKLTVTSLTLHTKGSSTVDLTSSQQLPTTIDSPPSSPIVLEDLDELDLNKDFSKVPNTRPIGGLTRVRTANNVTHISSSSLAERDGEGGDEKKMMEMVLVARGVCLQPGENKIQVTGAVRGRSL